MARVIHTADTHIGYRQYHSPERQRDFLRAFEQVVEDAIEDEMDALVHAGDLFHDTRPAIPELMATVEALRRLDRAGIPFLGVVGNHEGTRERQWLDLFADLGLATRLDREGTVIGNVTFYGLDYVPPAQRDRLEYEFSEPTTEYSALVAHGLFEPFPHADWDTERVLASANVAFDALLLGDNHTRGQQQIGDTWVTYPGSTERVSAAERQDRNYNIVRFDDSVRIANRSIDGNRPWQFVDVTLTGSVGTSEAIARAREHNISDAVVIVRITGEGGEIAPARIEETLEDAGALLVRVMDERERPDEDDIVRVNFADPDRAVEERLRELPLSGAGELIDAMVRDDTIADTNVRERVTARIETMLGETPAAFEHRTVSDPDTAEEADDPDDAEEASNEESQASIAEFG